MTERFDQREFVRVPDCSDVVYTPVSSGKKIKSEVKDISQAGICFLSEEKLEPGTTIELTLTLEKIDFSFVAKGVVRWVNEVVKNRRYEVGIKFVDLPDQDIRRLLNYMNSMKKFDSYR